MLPVQNGQDAGAPAPLRKQPGAQVPNIPLNRAQAAIAQGIADAASFFNIAPDLVVSNTLSFLNKRGNEHFGEIAATSKRNKQIADSLVKELNVPHEGIPTLIAKLMKGDYKSLESLVLPVELEETELYQILAGADASGLKIRDLDLSGCGRLTGLPDNLPHFLTSLDISNCHAISRLPENLPLGLKELNASECYHLSELPLLPESLEELNLSFCDGIESISEPLPDGLETLDLTGCSSLRDLPPHLPTDLIELNLSGCTILESLPAHLPSGLERLNVTNCDLLDDLPEVLPPRLQIVGLPD